AEAYVQVKELYGAPEKYGTFDDVVALRLGATTPTSTVHVLKYREDPVKPGEKVFILGVPHDSESPQQAYPATITVNSENILDGYSDDVVEFAGLSGAPIIDTRGYAVGVLTSGPGLFNREKKRGFSAHTILELGDVIEGAHGH
ncbi:MAG TPA: hypothetical protein VIU12_10280, partial [Chryseolinea sp.]